MICGTGRVCRYPARDTEEDLGMIGVVLGIGYAVALKVDHPLVDEIGYNTPRDRADACRDGKFNCSTGSGYVSVSAVEFTEGCEAIA